MAKVSMIGVDLAKNVFQVHGVDAAGKVVVRRQLQRRQMEKFFAELPPRRGGGDGGVRWRASLGSCCSKARA